MLRSWTYEPGQHRLRQGEEMGRFLLGSTVVLLLPAPLGFDPGWQPGGPVRMGEAMAFSA
jgi:phosphatidylserine decarboxylase